MNDTRTYLFMEELKVKQNRNSPNNAKQCEKNEYVKEVAEALL